MGSLAVLWIQNGDQIDMVPAHIFQVMRFPIILLIYEATGGL
jgi:hypothetical protein